MKNILIIVIIFITFASCNKQSANQNQITTSMATSNGTAYYERHFAADADLANLTIACVQFAVTEEFPTDQQVFDESLVTVGVDSIGENYYKISGTFPTYPIATGKVMKYHLFFNVYETATSIQKAAPFLKATNVLPSDSILR